jgi:hypothetical protein
MAAPLEPSYLGALPFSRPHLLALLVALIALLSPAAAEAASQTFEDGDDGVAEGFYGKQVDARQVQITQDGGQTTVSVKIETPSSQPAAENDHVVFFLDSNADGKSDYGLAFSGFAQGPYHYALVSTPGSTPGCQRLASGGGPIADGDQPEAAPQDGLATLSLTFASSAIGNASSFRWAVYALNDSLQRSTYDYVPDASNPRTPSSGEASQNLDGCDTNGDGTYGGSGDETTNNDSAYPVDLSHGSEFPGAQQPGPGPGPGPTDPTGQPITSTTFSVAQAPKMPNVRGKKLATALDLIQGAGINAIIEKKPDFRTLKGKQPGQVLKQTPGPKRPIPSGTMPYKKIVLTYYVGPIKSSAKDSCPTKALSGALRGEDPAETQKYLDRQCDEVGLQYRFSSRVNEATLTGVGEPGSELRAICRNVKENGKKVKYCDVVRVPPETKNFYYQTPCEVNEKKRELVCQVVRKKKDKPKDPNEVIGTVTVPKNANDLVLAVSDAEEFTKNDTYRLGFTQNWRLLTTDQYVLRYSCIRVRVLTGKGELADRAKVALAIPAGMSPDTVVEQPTDKKKGAYFCVRFLKPGTVHLVATAKGTNGGVIHGVKSIKVEQLKEERRLLDERVIRPSGKHNGTTLFEVVSKQQPQHEAQIATGGGELAQVPGTASTAPATVGVAHADNTVTVYQNVPVIPESQLTQGVQGTADGTGVHVPGAGNFTNLTDVSKSTVFDADLASSVIANDGASAPATLIGDHGTGLIGQAGGNIVSEAGGSLIGQAGGN